MKRLLLISLVVIGIASGVFLVNFVIFLYTPYGHAASFVIEPGMNLDQTINRLEEQKLVSNRPLFKFYVVVMQGAGKIRAGEYQFPERVTPRQLLSALETGDFSRLRITIPEGKTVREIAGQLASLVDPNEFMQKAADPLILQTLPVVTGVSVTSVEGSLFPDTYEIYRPKGAEEVMTKMIGRFREVFEEEWRQRPADFELTPYQTVILASIVEKETGRAEERPLIASVFFNRLRRGIALASDPTVIYGIENFSGNLTRADLERPGSYNTYLNPGLPPTPICNPGRAALQAVINPPTTDYLYFVSRNDGTHQFSRTIEEHSRAVYRYQVRGEQGQSPTTETSPR